MNGVFDTYIVDAQNIIEYPDVKAKNVCSLGTLHDLMKLTARILLSISLIKPI